ncbi:MAG: hypothetical protein AAB441_01615 [Patescibacteria group bacterium]
MENKSKIFTYLLVIFFAMFIGTGIFLLVSSRQVVVKEGAPSTSATIKRQMIFPTEAPKRGKIKLIENKSEEPVSLKTNPYLSLNIVASSDGENVSAFDVLISYDPLAFDFVEAVSLDPAFQVYSFRKDKHLTLTVVKTSQDQNLSVFSGKAVVKLSYKPKKDGDFTFTILSVSDKETSKFVNEKTEVIYPGVNAIKVTVN